MNMTSVAMEKQLKRNTCPPCIRLKIVTTMHPIQPHRLSDERRETRLTAWVAQWGVELV